MTVTGLNVIKLFVVWCGSPCVSWDSFLILSPALAVTSPVSRTAVASQILNPIFKTGILLLSLVLSSDSAIPHS